MKTALFSLMISISSLLTLPTAYVHAGLLDARSEIDASVLTLNVHDTAFWVYADPLPLEAMYTKKPRLKNGRVVFVSKRGTSKLEGYHRFWNQLTRGTHYSPRLIGAIAIDHGGRWNELRGRENAGWPDYIIFDHQCAPCMHPC